MQVAAQYYIPQQTCKAISEIVHTHMVQLGVIYAEEYEKDGQALINCFIKYPSIRTASAFIVKACDRAGILKEARLSGKDFSEYVNKQPIEEKYKRVLAELLLIIYAIIKK